MRDLAVGQLPVIHVDLFAGVGTAQHAAQLAGLRPVLTIAVEHNDDCKSVLRFTFPKTALFGAFETFNAGRAANAIQSCLSTYLDEKAAELELINREAEEGSTWVPAGPLAVVLVTGGAPCHRISSVRGPAAGSKKDVFESLFSAQFDWVADLDAELNVGGVHAFDIVPVFETIVPRGQETAEALAAVAKKASWEVHPMGAWLFNSCDHLQWQCDGALLYARPRLFYTRIDFSDEKTRLVSGADGNNSVKYTQVIYDNPQHLRTVDLTDDDGYGVADKVANGGVRIGCLTTPAPDELGRSLPPGRTEADFEAEAITRWKESGQMFGPWAYRDINLAWKGVPDEEAGDGEERLIWREFSARQRELLHELPMDFTRLGLKKGQVHELNYMSRARMVANSWHIGVAKFIMKKAIGFIEGLRQNRMANNRTVRKYSPVLTPQI